MRQNFWRATLISVAAYAAAVLLGLMGDFRLTMFAVLVLLVPWTLFCTIRAILLRSGGAHQSGALDRESYGFALGGSVSSFVLLSAIVVLSQAV